MCLLFWLMYVDFSSLFVMFELYKASFDKYLLEFTKKKSLVKKIFEKLFLPHVCIKKIDLPDMWWKKVFNWHEQRILSSMNIPAPSPSVIK